MDYIKSGFENFKHIIDLSRFDFVGFKGVFVFRVRCFAYRSYTIKHSYNGYYCCCFTCWTNQFGKFLSRATLGTSVAGVVTAVLASLSANIKGKKLAFANCIFNFGIALKVALFHTLFNLIGVVLFSFFTPQIVLFLNKIVKAPKDKNKDKPVVWLSFSDTAIEALRKESEHLYNNTYTIVAHAIGFSCKDIQSDKSFKEILENKKWFSRNMDLDYLYQTRIKVLFEAIIDFSTKAQVYINDETKNHKIFTFKMAVKNLVETTKNLKIIQANIKKYSSSSNEFLALEYNKIRSNLGELLRSIEELRVVEDREKLYLIIKNLQKGKEILKEIDTLTLSNIEHLISVRKITTAEGISILNDTTFAAKIAEELIGAVEVIFSKDISN